LDGIIIIAVVVLSAGEENGITKEKRINFVRLDKFADVKRVTVQLAIFIYLYLERVGIIWAHAFDYWLYCSLRYKYLVSINIHNTMYGYYLWIL